VPSSNLKSEGNRYLAMHTLDRNCDEKLTV
jgi:hypothetical protein